MSQRVVDALEAIQIDEHDGDMFAVAMRARHRLFQLLMKQLSIRQACERIVHREVVHFVLGVFALRDVVYRAI